jgi:hypothetical protein
MMSIGRGRHHDNIDQAGIEHLLGIRESGYIRCEFSGSRNALRVNVADRSQLKPLGVLNCLIVFMADSAVRQESYSHQATLLSRPGHAIRHGRTD